MPVGARTSAAILGCNATAMHARFDPFWPRARRNVSGQDFPVSLPFVIEWLVGRLTAVMDMCWTFEVLVLCVVLHLYTVCIPSDR